MNSNTKRSGRWRHRLKAEFGVRDLTDDVAQLVEKSSVTEGLVVVSVTGSTGAITTIEYEPGR